MRFEFWQRWLLVCSILIALFGLGMALLCTTPLFDVFDSQVNPVFWDSAAAPEQAARFQGWVYGVLGATMMGWGITIAFLAHHPFRRRERWAWTATAAALGAWFVLDTSLSLAFGVVFNAVFNTVLIVLVGVLPLAFTYRAMRQAGR